MDFGAKHETKESMELQKSKEVRMYLFFLKIKRHGLQLLFLSRLRFNNDHRVVSIHVKSKLSWKGHFPFLWFVIFYWLHFQPWSQFWKLWRNEEYEVEYGFEYIFWMADHFVIKLVQLLNIVMGNILRKYFVWFGGLGPKSLIY